MLKIILLLSLVALGLLDSRNVYANPPPDKLRIGVSSILSGPWAAWGATFRNGFLLAADQLQNPYIIDFQDDRADPKETLSNTKKFLADGSKLIAIAPMEGLDSSAPVAARQNIPVIALGGVVDEILARHPNIVALNHYSDAHPRFIAAYLQSLTQVKSLAVIYGTSNVGEAMGARMIDDAQQRGIKISLYQSLPVESTDFRTLAARIVAANPDALFVHQGETSILSFIRQMREAGYKGRILTIFTLECEETKKAMGSYLEGVQYSFPLGADEENEKWISFSKNYFNRYGAAPDAVAAMGYDAFMIIAQAATACVDAKLECILSYFREHPIFDGVAGRLTIDKNRGPLRPIGIKEIRNGKFIWVTKDIKL